MVLISDFNRLIFLNREGEKIQLLTEKDTLTNVIQNYKLYHMVLKKLFSIRCQILLN